MSYAAYQLRTEDERERLTKLEAEIAQAPDREKLEGILVAYHQWFNDQRESVRTTLRGRLLFRWGVELKPARSKN